MSSSSSNTLVEEESAQTGAVDLGTRGLSVHEQELAAQCLAEAFATAVVSESISVPPEQPAVTSSEYATPFLPLFIRKSPLSTVLCFQVPH